MLRQKIIQTIMTTLMAGLVWTTTNAQLENCGTPCQSGCSRCGSGNFANRLNFDPSSSNTNAPGNYSTAGGRLSRAPGLSSFAFGGNSPQGDFAIAEGKYNFAFGGSPSIINTSNTPLNSFAFGENTVLDGTEFSFGFGKNVSLNSTEYSFGFGQNLDISSNDHFVVGWHNERNLEVNPDGLVTKPRLKVLAEGQPTDKAVDVQTEDGFPLFNVREDGAAGFNLPADPNRPRAPYQFEKSDLSPFMDGGKANIVQNYSNFPQFEDCCPALQVSNDKAKWLALGERPPGKNDEQVAYGLAEVWDNSAGNFVLLDQTPGDDNTTEAKDLAITFQDVGSTGGLTTNQGRNRIRFLFRNSLPIEDARSNPDAVYELMSLEPTGEVAVGDYSGSVTPDAKRFEVKWDEESDGNNFNNSKPIMKVLRKKPGGSGSESIVSIKDNGNVYIGPTNKFPFTGSSTSDNLQVNGSAYTNGTWGPSDIRYKTDTQLIQKPLEKINKLDGITYRYAENQYTKNRNFRMDDRHSGVVAQQLKEVLPEAVRKGHGGLYAVNYDAVIPLLIETNKTQQKQIEDQKVKIKNQQEQIEELKLKTKKVEKLEQKVESLSNQIDRLKDNGNNPANRFKNNSSENLNERTVTIGNEDNEEQAMLLQNRPNPYSGETVIPYYLPKSFDKASMLITNTNGQIIKRIALENAGKGELTLRTEGLNAGQYLYSLIVDGRKIQTRKMVISKK